MTTPATDAERTRALAEGLVGTASMQSPETLAELSGFTLVPDVFDEVAFACERCGWFCGMDEANDSEDGSGFLCDDCDGEGA